MNTANDDEQSALDACLSYSCHNCAKPLCLRKRTINLALGHTEAMYCLDCLAVMNGQQARDILLVTKEYIAGRECFAKEWRRYESENDCPEPKHCFISECFSGNAFLPEDKMP